MFTISAREHGAARGCLEGVQPDGGDPVQGESKLLHKEPRRVRPSSPLLPKRAQRVVSRSPAKWLQT